MSSPRLTSANPKRCVISSSTFTRPSRSRSSARKPRARPNWSWGNWRWPKATGERLKALLEEWKAAPRVDRTAEQALWKRFWRLATDPQAADDMGVRVAQGEAGAKHGQEQDAQHQNEADDQRPVPAARQTD